MTTKVVILTRQPRADQQRSGRREGVRGRARGICKSEVRRCRYDGRSGRTACPCQVCACVSSSSATYRKFRVGDAHEHVRCSAKLTTRGVGPASVHALRAKKARRLPADGTCFVEPRFAGNLLSRLSFEASRPHACCLRPAIPRTSSPSRPPLYEKHLAHRQSRKHVVALSRHDGL